MLIIIITYTVLLPGCLGQIMSAMYFIFLLMRGERFPTVASDSIFGCIEQVTFT